MSTSDPYGGNTGQSGGAGNGWEQPSQPAGPSPWNTPQGAPQPNPADPYGQPAGYPPQPYGQQYGQPVYPGYPAPAPTGTNVLAIIALITAILCGPLIGLILGIIALVQTNRSGQEGRGIAIAAIVISSVVTVLVTIAVIASVADSKDTRSTSGPPVSAPAVPDTLASPSPTPTARQFDAKIGDCLAINSVEDRFFRLPVVRCTTPHRAEVFAVMPLTGKYPGWEKVKETGLNTCEKRYNKLPRSLRKRLGQVQLLVFGPQDERSWRAGFRSAYCILLDEDRTYTKQLVKS